MVERLVYTEKAAGSSPAAVTIKSNPIKEKMERENNFKKVAMVIAFKDFKDEEYFLTREVLDRAGIEVKTFSNKTGVAIGSGGNEVKVDFLLKDLNPKDFDAVIFIGGPGCLLSLDNEDSYSLIKNTISDDKILAAICISPVILAKSGVLRGVKSTVWSSALDKKPIDILKVNGAIYDPGPVAQDKKIITANGPLAAKEFGEKILSALRQ